jgi:O-antigen/teichoic acid export membrane protein
MIWKNASWLGVVPVLLNIVALFSTGFITRRVGPAGFGQFSIAVALTGLTVTITDLGLRSLAVRNLARSGPGARRGLHDLMSVRLITSAVATVMAWVMAATIAALSTGSRLPPVLLVSSLGIIPTAMVGVFTDGLMARDQARATSAATFWSGALLTIASVVAVALRPTGEMLAASYLVGPFIKVTMLSHRAREFYGPIRLRWRPKQWRVLTARSFGFFKVSLTGQAINRIETPLIGWLFGEKIAGIFAASMTLAERLGAVIDSVTTAALPTLMRLRGDAARIGEVVARIMHPLLTALLVGSIMAMMGSTAAVTVVFGQAYEPGGIALAVALFALPVNAVNAMLSEGFIAFRRHEFVAATAQRGQMVTAAMMAVLPWALGVAGAPLARLLGALVVNVISVRASLGPFAVVWEPQRLRQLLRAVLWAAPMPFLLWLGDFGPVVTVLVSGGGFLCWLVATAVANNWLRLLRPQRDTVEVREESPPSAST